MRQSNITISKVKLVFIFIIIITSFQFAQQKGGKWMFENNGNDEAIWDVVENNGVLDGVAIYNNVGIIIQGNYYLSIEDSANYGDFKVSDQEELDFLNENFAASLWFYPVTGYDSPQHLLMKGDRSGAVKENNYALRINNGYIEFIVHSESGSKKSVRSSFKVVEYEWNFVAVFYDYTKSKLFLWNEIESAAIDTFDFNAPLFPNNDKLYIGSSGENGYKRFWGRIDDVRISTKESDVLDISTNVEQQNLSKIQAKFTLNQNYPNPFNPTTTIKYSIPNFFNGHNSLTQNVSLSIFDIMGREIIKINEGDKSPGNYKIEFDASNLSSGVYYYTLKVFSGSSNFTQTKKMMVIK